MGGPRELPQKSYLHVAKSQRRVLAAYFSLVSLGKYIFSTGLAFLTDAIKFAFCWSE